MANSDSVPYFLWFAEKAMQSNEFKFTFISLFATKPEMVEQMKKFNSECFWVRFDHHKRKTSMLSAIFKLRSLFKKLKPDIVHSHLFDDTLPALIAAKLTGVKLRFVTKQDTYFHWLYAPGIVKFDRLNNSLATHIIAVSGECKQFILEKEKAESQKVSLIHHGIHLDKLSKVNETIKKELIHQYGLNDKIVIGTIARLIDWKGHEIILEVAERIVKHYPNVVFLFIGQGDLKSKIENIAAEKGISKNIILTGWVDRDRIPSTYGIMDIYLHAARYEPFGFVIAEAMLNAVPVLSTKTGAALDAIKHKENGYLVEYNDVKGFTDGIDFLLQNDKAKIGEKGKLTAMQMYDFEKMWSSYTSWYKEALSTS
ncbi:MAG: glycosyltransferase family 4 protein [Sphingobacteriaceae bacterium]|nr:glycosyltransferase family 4 protein [Sphingobacteriaceae bacterium]